LAFYGSDNLGLPSGASTLKTSDKRERQFKNTGDLICSLLSSATTSNESPLLAPFLRGDQRIRMLLFKIGAATLPRPLIAVAAKLQGQDYRLFFSPP
jgi:hypothetical protein